MFDVSTVKVTENINAVLFKEEGDDEQSFGTHIEIWRDSSGPIRYWGHYRMSLEKAVKDLSERVARGI
jgi:hypothetical protein